MIAVDRTTRRVVGSFLLAPPRQDTKEYKSKRTLSGDIAQFFLAEESADQGRYFL